MHEQHAWPGAAAPLVANAVPLPPPKPFENPRTDLRLLRGPSRGRGRDNLCAPSWLADRTRPGCRFLQPVELLSV
eukprot:scaffold471422_cov24-Prasinocladus_malaysianus.AAC.1